MVPVNAGICEFAFGIYPYGPCETSYAKCKFAEPIDVPCIQGLAYDEVSRTCNWPDLMEHCNPERNKYNFFI